MFRFTIRDVLWLTVVAALAVGWWIDHKGALAKSVLLREAIEAALYNYEQDTLGGRMGIQLPDGEYLNARSPGENVRVDVNN